MTTLETDANPYLQAAMEAQSRAKADLAPRLRSPAYDAEGALPAPARSSSLGLPDFGGGGPAFPPPPAHQVRETGALWFRSVIVPPNTYVVHTRKGHADPLHLGLGVSFRYNPRTDAYLTVPATTQTLLLHARCICRERQGLLVQGYLQWCIDDFAVAYRRLDFSDPEAPFRVVDAQLREQAEAAIKDTVATMSIDDVLTDKRPIIEELTSRLRETAEGRGEPGAGLGLRIVTVQIKEAVVCSSRVWEDLQRPFRAERAMQARLQEIEAEAEVARREAEARQVAERHAAQSEAETLEATAAQARARIEEDHARASLEEARADERALARAERQRAVTELELELERARRALAAEHPDAGCSEALLARLPEILAAWPRPDVAVSLGGEGADPLRLITALRDGLA